MSNPKFAVGDLVAVCNSSLTIVIPETRITDICFKQAGVYRNFLGEKKYLPDRWAYVVLNAPCSDRVKKVWFSEWCIRPIIPGEYLSSTLNTQSPVEVDA
jgi:hypothetical protein